MKNLLKQITKNITIIIAITAILLMLCITIAKLWTMNESNSLKLARQMQENRQLNDAIELIGLGGEGDITDRKTVIRNIIENRGVDSKYSWRYPELEFPLKRDTTYITSEYNEIRYSELGQFYFKIKSVDLKCVDDDRVKASITGICEVGNDETFGNYIIIKNDKWLIKYGHLDRIDVVNGQEIEKGVYIGLVGNTGNCKYFNYKVRKWLDITDFQRERGVAKHLDYTVLKNGIEVNVFANSLYGNEVL